MTTRITGMVSGLDIDSLVKAGTATYQAKLDKAKQQEQITQWKQDQYRAISTSVSDFNNKYLDPTSSDSLLLSTNWATTTFTSSNSAAVSATGVNSSATPGNYKVDVTQLASAATYTLSSTNYPSSSITINSSPIDLSSASSITDPTAKGTAIANLINTALGSSSTVTATYSQLSGGVVLKTQSMGSSASFTIDDVDGAGAINAGSPITGTNLKATITNGAGTPYKIDDSNNVTTSNTTTLDGIKFNFNDTTTAGSPVTLTGTTDTTALQTKIESFMKDYNTLMTTINGKIYESYDSSYQPLTDDQKSSMSATDITNWTTKAQTGLLHNDDYLESLAADMKQTMSTFMSSTGISLENLGIKPVQNYDSQNGTYNVDSSALKSALNGGVTRGGHTITVADIQSLFTNLSTNSTSTQSSAGDGVLQQLKVALNNNVMKSGSQFQQLAGVVGTTSEYTNEITQQLKDETTLISTLTDQLNTQQDALYMKYSNMETQLSQIKSSSSVFSSGSSGQ